ncbi:amidohydrolase family protein [Variovorax ureilyticus]|uniref:Amidohydrolase family protein n=1 Tax=Variovorax ureilyticus TaxID=1836198 RepID=A0ABU8VM77_9BURK
MGVIRGVALGGRQGAFDITIEGDRVSAIAASADASTPRWLAMPSLVNFHAHANRAFAAPAQRPTSLTDAVAAAGRERASATVEIIRQRAARLFRSSIEHGVSLIRTHTDVDLVTGMRAIDGVLAAASDLRAALDIEVVAFANACADPARVEMQALLTEAVAQGASLIGAVPALCREPAVSLDALLDLAVALDVAVDIHLDEHLDVDSALIEQLVEGSVARRLEGRVSVSHACVLSAMDRDHARRLLDRMAAAAITLVVLPELNLYLQGRGGAPRERGIAPVIDAIAAGVPVRFGTDNVRDWFFPFGDGDMLETGYVGAIASHVDGADDLQALMCGGRRCIAVGEVANLVLVPASSFDDAIARRPAGRVSYHRGQRVGVDAIPTSSGETELVDGAQ